MDEQMASEEICPAGCLFSEALQAQPPGKKIVLYSDLLLLLWLSLFLLLSLLLVLFVFATTDKLLLLPSSTIFTTAISTTTTTTTVTSKQRLGCQAGTGSLGSAPVSPGRFHSLKMCQTLSPKT